MSFLSGCLKKPPTSTETLLTLLADSSREMTINIDQSFSDFRMHERQRGRVTSAPTKDRPHIVIERIIGTSHIAGITCHGFCFRENWHARNTTSSWITAQGTKTNPSLCKRKYFNLLIFLHSSFRVQYSRLVFGTQEEPYL